MGEALSAGASGNGEAGCDSEPAGATEGAAKLFSVAGADCAGIEPGTRLRENSGSVFPRSGSVTPGGSCGFRAVPGGKAVAGFAGRIGGRGIPGASVFPVAPFLSSSAFLRALNWARRCSSSFLLGLAFRG